MSGNEPVDEDTIRCRRWDDGQGIAADLRLRSFSMVQLPEADSLEQDLVDVDTVAFGDRAEELAAASPYDELLEFGYLRCASKEFFACKTGLPLSTMWPSPEFQRFAESLFWRQDALARRLFLALNVGGAEVLQGAPLSSDEISHSFMHLFRYFGGGPPAPGKLPCEAHTDSGLVTVIPRARGEAGLECLDRSTGRFVATELLFREEPRVCTVLAGETLAALTRSEISGTVHRVVPTAGPRVSVPFQLRASPEWVLKMARTWC